MTKAFNSLKAEIDLVEGQIQEIMNQGGGAVKPADRARWQELQAKRRSLGSDLANLGKEGWESSAANADPGKFQSWKLEADGVDVWGQSGKDLDPLRREVLDLRKRENLVEKQIGDLREQMPFGKTTSSLQTEVSSVEGELQSNRQALEAAKSESGPLKSQADDAATSLREAEGQRAAKDAELQQAKKEASDVETEMQRVSQGSGQPSLSEQLKPGFVKGIENAMASAAATVGQTMEHYFGGQSPQEIARILTQGRDTVARLLRTYATKRA